MSKCISKHSENISKDSKRALKKFPKNTKNSNYGFNKSLKLEGKIT